MIQNLRAEIERFVPFDSQEAENQRDFLRLLSVQATPQDRQVYTPGHLTASAFVASTTDRKVLLLYHQKLQRWLQPGGHIEKIDASFSAAAQRELLEETGLKKVIPTDVFDLDIQKIPARGDQPNHLHFDVRYLVKVNGLPDYGPQESEVRWFGLAEIEAIGPDIGTRRAADKLVARGFLE